jgi:hypothetical protein
MKTLLNIFGWPHELLHVLALRLIGRRAVAITRTHVDIPDDLSTGQYVFVAGLPALVFWSITAVCLLSLVNAPTIPVFILWAVLTPISMIAAAGTVGDIVLISARLLESQPPEQKP